MHEFSMTLISYVANLLSEHNILAARGNIEQQMLFDNRIQH